LLPHITLADAPAVPSTRPIPGIYFSDSLPDATAKHFDLRVHLDGQTVSWAVPKGFSNFPLRDSTGNNSGSRLAIQTDLHPLSDALYEGGGIGTKAVWDVGSYRVGSVPLFARASMTDKIYRSYLPRALFGGSLSENQTRTTRTRIRRRSSGRRTKCRRTSSVPDTTEHHSRESHRVMGDQLELQRRTMAVPERSRSSW
jgi:hypothetical protein